MPAERSHRFRRPALVFLTLFLVAAACGLWALARLSSGPRYDVISIATLPDYQDPAALQEAWRLPVARLYQPGLQYQSNGSVCGPSSLANVLRSLGQGTASQSSVLAGSGLCWTGLCIPGLTLDELAGLAQRQRPGRVQTLRNLSLAEFRQHLQRSNDPSRRYIINFHRGPLFGRGGGHHSPIAGYLPDRDRVLVLDVNQTFTPWLVPTERLHAAMDTIDSGTGKKRGLLLIE